MRGINDELNQVIKEEVSAKSANEQAKAIVKQRRPVTRAAIEDLEELARLEREFILDV